mmetsp:Transcript_7210/g.9245  ORF Transcript_7210/g.9245 Transcript_7210/m.9245 type:complete len:151 (-) Transcript_7210:357-809(-)
MREDYRVPLHMMQVKNLSQIQQDQLLCLVISLVRRSAVISHPRLLDLLTIEELENEFERKPQHNQSHDQHCSNAHGNVSRELMEFSPCVGVKIIDVGHRFAQKVAQGCPALLMVMDEKPFGRDHFENTHVVCVVRGNDLIFTCMGKSGIK